MAMVVMGGMCVSRPYALLSGYYVGNSLFLSMAMDVYKVSRPYALLSATYRLCFVIGIAMAMVVVGHICTWSYTTLSKSYRLKNWPEAICVACNLNVVNEYN